MSFEPKVGVTAPDVLTQTPETAFENETTSVGAIVLEYKPVKEQETTMKNRSFYLSDESVEFLSNMASAYNKTRSALLEEILQQMIKQSKKD